MHAGEIFLIIFFNSLIFAGFYFAYIRLMEKRLRHLKSEVQELEDLVAAIIEEFEDIAVSFENPAAGETEMMTPFEVGSDEQLQVNNLDRVVPASLSQQPDPPPTGLETGAGPGNESRLEKGSPPADLRHRQILDLWQDGIPVEEIARQLGTGRGEVQLILGIYQKM